MKNEIEKLTKQIEALTEEVKRLREVSQPVAWPVYTYINPNPNPYYIARPPTTCG